MGNREAEQCLGTPLKLGSRPDSGVIVVHKLSDIKAAQATNGYSQNGHGEVSLSTVTTVFDPFTRIPVKRIRRFDGVVTIEDLIKKKKKKKKR